MGEMALSTQASYGKSTDRPCSLVTVALGHVCPTWAVPFHLTASFGAEQGAVGLGEVGKMEEPGMSGAWECGTWRVEVEVGCLMRPSTGWAFQGR